MRYFLIIAYILAAASFVKAKETTEYIPKNNMPTEDLVIDADSFYDPKTDYSTFSGRVTDRDETASILKVTSENKNTNFFRAGDPLKFRVQINTKGDFCEGFVRSIEEGYFVIFVKDLKPCFPNNDYFRRGTALVFQSDRLAERVREASLYRASLIKKKKNYMSQLNQINQNLFSYEEKKVQIASEYDRRIAEIEAEKVKELDRLLNSRNDEIRLQRELAYRLDSIDKEMNFYRIDRHELLVDRWHLDQDLGYPVYKRPEAVRAERAPNSDN